MKKILSYFLASLMLLSVLFAAVSCGEAADKPENGSDATEENTKEFNVSEAAGEWTASKQMTIGDLAVDEAEEDGTPLPESIKGLKVDAKFDLKLGEDGKGTFVVKFETDIDSLKTEIGKYVKELYPSYSDEQLEQMIQLVMAIYGEMFNADDTSDVEVMDGNKIYGVMDDDEGEPLAATLEFKGNNLVIVAPEEVAGDSSVKAAFPLELTRK